jgi:4-amino-4-deoxy-L-arabinose transferase-like glycosyltransferase
LGPHQYLCLAARGENDLTSSANRPASQDRHFLTDWLLLAGFCGFLFFFGLSHFGLLGADEPRYAQVAREMLARHDWITPTLAGQPWLEKPVLYYWQAMLAYRLFGVSDWAARIPSAVDATLMVAAVFLFFRRFRPGIQLDAALITASAAGVIGFGRAASMDMPLASTFAIGMLAWYAWHETGRKSYLGLFYALIALGALAKGPVAPFLAAGIIVAFAAAAKNLGVIGKTLWVPGILIFLCVAGPWYVAVQLHNPEFFRVFILEHNLSRFGTNRYHHPQPIWFYIPVVIIGLLPWAVVAAAALFENIRGWWRTRGANGKSKDAFNIFLFTCFILPILFFSLSKSKLPGYILPALPAGTLLLAEYVRRCARENRKTGGFLVALHSVVSASLLFPALLLQYIVLHRLAWNRATVFAVALTVVLALGAAATLRLRPGLSLLRFVTLIPVILAIAAVLRLDARFLDERFSARPLSDSITHIDNGSLATAVFGVRREIEYGLHFYRNQRIARYESGEVPEVEHILVAPHATPLPQIESKLPGRRISYLGSDEPQGLDYFWVSAPSLSMGHMRTM